MEYRYKSAEYSKLEGKDLTPGDMVCIPRDFSPTGNEEIAEYIGPQAPKSRVILLRLLYGITSYSGVNKPPLGHPYFPVDPDSRYRAFNTYPERVHIIDKKSLDKLNNSSKFYNGLLDKVKPYTVGFIKNTKEPFIKLWESENKVVGLPYTIKKSTILTYVDNKLTLSTVSNSTLLLDNSAILNFLTATVIRTEDSSELFGFRGKKNAMLGKCFSIINVTEDFLCKKDNVKRDIITLKSDTNIKFLLSDVELTLNPDINLKSYNKPKDKIKMIGIQPGHHLRFRKAYINEVSNKEENKFVLLKVCKYDNKNKPTVLSVANINNGKPMIKKANKFKIIQ